MRRVSGGPQLDLDDHFSLLYFNSVYTRFVTSKWHFLNVDDTKARKFILILMLSLDSLRKGVFFSIILVEVFSVDTASFRFSKVVDIQARGIGLGRSRCAVVSRSSKQNPSHPHGVDVTCWSVTSTRRSYRLQFNISWKDPVRTSVLRSVSSLKNFNLQFNIFNFEIWFKYQ